MKAQNCILRLAPNTLYTYSTYSLMGEDGLVFPISGRMYKTNETLINHNSYTDFIPLVEPNFFINDYAYDTRTLSYIDKYLVGIFNGKTIEDFVKSFEELPTKFDKELFCLTNILVPMQITALRDYIRLSDTLPYDEIYALQFKISDEKENHLCFNPLIKPCNRRSISRT